MSLRSAMQDIADDIDNDTLPSCEASLSIRKALARYKEYQWLYDDAEIEVCINEAVQEIEEPF